MCMNLSVCAITQRWTKFTIYRLQLDVLALKPDYERTFVGLVHSNFFLLSKWITSNSHTCVFCNLSGLVLFSHQLSTCNNDQQYQITKNICHFCTALHLVWHNISTHWLYRFCTTLHVYPVTYPVSYQPLYCGGYWPG